MLFDLSGLTAQQRTAWIADKSGAVARILSDRYPAAQGYLHTRNLIKPLDASAVTGEEVAVKRGRYWGLRAQVAPADPAVAIVRVDLRPFSSVSDALEDSGTIAGALGGMLTMAVAGLAVAWGFFTGRFAWSRGMFRQLLGNSILAALTVGFGIYGLCWLTQRVIFWATVRRAERKDLEEALYKLMMTAS